MTQPSKPSWTHGRLGALLLLVLAGVAACVMNDVNQAGAAPSGYSTTR